MRSKSSTPKPFFYASKKKNIGKIVLFFSLVLLISFVSIISTKAKINKCQPAPNTFKNFKKAPLTAVVPDTWLLAENGEKHSLKDYEGKGLVVNFWATRCAPCLREMPQLNRLAAFVKINGVEVLDLRKNFNGDEGVEAIARSSLFSKLRELDLRNNGISRLGVKILAESKTLGCLEKIDLRLNQLGKRWEEKFNEKGNFPKLKKIKTI